MRLSSTKKILLSLAVVLAFQAVTTTFAASALWYNGTDSWYRSCTELAKNMIGQYDGDSNYYYAWDGTYSPSYPGSFPGSYVLFSKSTVFNTESGNNDCPAPIQTGGYAFSTEIINGNSGAEAYAADGGISQGANACDKLACSPRNITYTFNMLSSTNADATFFASTDLDTVLPGATIKVRLGGATGNQGSYYNGWFQGGVLGNLMQGILCWMPFSNCPSTPPSVTVIATAPSGAGFLPSMGGSIAGSNAGVIDVSGNLKAPMTPGNYNITVNGCNQDNTRADQGCRTVYLPFTVTAPPSTACVALSFGGTATCGPSGPPAGSCPFNGGTTLPSGSTAYSTGDPVYQPTLVNMTDGSGNYTAYEQNCNSGVWQYDGNYFSCSFGSCGGYN